MFAKNATKNLKVSSSHQKLMLKSIVRENATKKVGGKVLSQFVLCVKKHLSPILETNIKNIVQMNVNTRQKLKMLLRRVQYAIKSLLAKVSIKKHIVLKNVGMTITMDTRKMVDTCNIQKFTLKMLVTFGNIVMLWNRSLVENSSLGNRFTTLTRIKKTIDQKISWLLFPENTIFIQ